MRILSISPQNEHPPLAGGSKRFFALAEALRCSGIENDNLFRNGGLCGGELLVSAERTGAGRVTKALLASESILLGKTYNEVRFANRAWYRKWESVINGNYDVIIVHFLCAYPLFRECYRGSAEVVIDTHNDDWKWWSNLRTGLVSAMVGSIGIRRTTKIMEMVPDGTWLSHVSTEDQRAYAARFPNLRHVVVPNACRANPRTVKRRYGSGDVKKLLFFGSLSSRINIEGLRHFEKLYWPELRDLGHMTVAGSKPGGEVVEMCGRNGWTLQPDVSERDLEELFGETDFSILPFPYGNGSKHKLFESLGRSVPVISTEAGVCGIEDRCRGIVIANEPAECKRALSMSAEDYSSREIAASEWARRHSWEASVGKLLDALKLKQQLA